MPENYTQCIHWKVCQFVCPNNLESCRHYNDGNEYYQKGYDDANEEWNERLNKVLRKYVEDNG